MVLLIPPEQTILICGMVEYVNLDISLNYYYNFVLLGVISIILQIPAKKVRSITHSLKQTDNIYRTDRHQPVNLESKKSRSGNWEF